MHNPTQKVNVRSVDRLRGQEVMRHTGYPVLEALRYTHSPVCDCIWQILDDTPNLWVSCGDLGANFAVRATDVDNCALAGTEIVIIEEMGQVVSWVEVGETHGGYELGLSAGVLRNLVEGVHVSVEGERVALW